VKTKLQLLLFLIGFFTIACKQERILEKSKKNQPEWIYGIKPNSIIVTGRGSNHAEAHQKAFLQLKDTIMQSVAVRVSSVINMDVSENVANEIYSYREKTTVNTKVSSDFLNTINGLSINKATDFYWEKVKNTSTKEQFVNYHIMYPFTDAELKKMVQDWELTDKQLTDDLKNIKTELESTNKLEDILSIQARLKSLEKVFGEPRKSQANYMLTDINNILSNLKLEILKGEPGKFLVQLKSNGKFFTSFNKPIFESTCATILNATFNEIDQGYWYIYDYHF